MDGENPSTTSGDLTPRAVAFVAGEEGLVREAYLDSENVWTWALGVTNASGHLVFPRYRDNPQPLDACVEVSIWLMRKRYLPLVASAFHGHALAEHQLAAALSFHWNTGAIGRASWVKSFLAGDIAKARSEFMQWRNPVSIIERRRRELDLFFEGKWPAKLGRVPVWRVAKPSYRPKGSTPVELLPVIERIMREKP